MSEIDSFEIMELESVSKNSNAGRRLFTLNEKILLQKLVLQYRVHTKNLNIACRKNAWERLTQEFNSVMGFNRTEAQLKKCWDNIKTRRRHVLQQARCTAPRSVEGSQDIKYKRADILPDPLMSVKQEETTWNDADDEDSTPKEFKVTEVSLDSEAASPPHNSPALTADEFSPLLDRLQGSACRASAGVETPPHHATTNNNSGYNKQHNNCAGTKSTDRSQDRTELLHRLRAAEQVWILKTLRERHATARLERERAQLERQRAHDESERAQLELEKARFERDAAQYQKEKALLELERAKRTDNSVIHNKISNEVSLH